MHQRPYDAPMPTKNPRLTITLEPTLSAQLRRLSELTGNSQGKLIAELLEGSSQTFAKLIMVLEAAEAAKESFKGAAGDDLREAHGRLESQLGLMLETFDGATAPLLEEAERVQRRGRKAVPGGGQARAARRQSPPSVPVLSPASTPISNRGVRSTRKNTKARP